MNLLAAEIMMEQTNFASVHGMINKDNISTAKDMAYLSCVAMKDELF
jgi:D-alanyl-D-alanine carboxypeptidase